MSYTHTITKTHTALKSPHLQGENQPGSVVPKPNQVCVTYLRANVSHSKPSNHVRLLLNLPATETKFNGRRVVLILALIWWIKPIHIQLSGNCFRKQFHITLLHIPKLAYPVLTGTCLTSSNDGQPKKENPSGVPCLTGVTITLRKGSWEHPKETAQSLRTSQWLSEGHSNRM